MEFINKLIDFALPEKKTLSNKTFILLVVLLGAYIANDFFGFTFYYQTNKKIEAIHNLNEIISNEKVDSAGRAYAQSLRKDVYEHKGRTASILHSIYSYALNEINGNPGIIRWLFCLSAATALFIGVPFAFVALFSGSEEFSDGARLILGLILWGGISFIICVLMPKIPFWGYTFTYLLNVVIQILVIIISASLDD
jgi:hypothetical protein